MMTEASVGRASDVADRSQRVAESALSAHSNLRQIGIWARNIRMARTQDEVDRNAASARQSAAASASDIDTALATTQRPDSKERLQKIKSLTSSFAAGVEEFAKTQGNLLALTDKRSAISTEWTKAVETELGSPALAKADNRLEIEKAFHQADAKVNTLRAAAWRLGVTGDASLIAAMTQIQNALKKTFNQLRGEADDKSLLNVVNALDSIVKRFLAANDEVVKTEQLKTEIGAQALKAAGEATELMETAVSVAKENNKAAKEQVSAQAAWANRLNVAMAGVVMVSLIGAMAFSFLGVARPMTRLNGALGEMAGGNLNVVIPGASRGDEIGDLAKTVVVIRKNAEQKPARRRKPN
jgi:nitrogen fixation/metabolism regulation signal transduction histidine kinase